jgi:hypothetical protein
VLCKQGVCCVRVRERVLAYRMPRFYGYSYEIYLMLPGFILLLQLGSLLPLAHLFPLSPSTYSQAIFNG